MINHWKKIVAVAAGIITLVAVVDLAIERVSAIQTDKEATTWRKQHELTQAEKDKAMRIDRLETENQRIRRQLANPNIEAWDKEQAILDRDENIKKIDCIRADRC